jgi:hypothetical protein
MEHGMAERLAVTLALALSPLLPAAAGVAGGRGQTPATQATQGEREMSKTETAVAAAGADASGVGGARGFDFEAGRWRVHNRRLRERLKGSTEWDEFESTVAARPILGGQGNEEEYRTGFAGGFVGMAFRFFDPVTQRWSIYWADSRRGVLEPPVVGSFAGDTGTFLGSDTFEGRPILMRFIWSRVTTATPRWEQAFSADGGKTWETNWTMDFTREASAAMGSVAHLEGFQVVELRRYSLVDGARERFARTFESYFPEAFEQLGAMVFGQFGERRNPARFTWLRGYKDMDARATVNAAFYFGPLWKEHRATMNGLMTDSDNVLLLRPLTPERGIPVLPAVDPADEAAEAAGARGVVVAQIFAVRADGVDALARQAEPSFAGYRAAGAREAGLLATLDAPNNFPQLPIRADGPFLVWLGVLEDDQALARFEPLAAAAARSLAAGGLLRGEPELVVLDPTARSRLRWLPGRRPLRDSR